MIKAGPLKPEQIYRQPDYIPSSSNAGFGRSSTMPLQSDLIKNKDSTDEFGDDIFLPADLECIDAAFLCDEPAPPPPQEMFFHVNNS